MSSNARIANRTRRPAHLWGILSAGATEVRRLSSPIPRGFYPVIQNFNGGQVCLVEDEHTNDRQLKIENRGARTSPYTVFFISEREARVWGGVNQIVKALRKKR